MKRWLLCCMCVSIFAATDVERGVDTIDVETGGNWLKKRVIWENAQNTYEKITGIMQRIVDARMEFFAKRSSSDKELNLFYSEIGFAQGELDEVLDVLLETIEKERDGQGKLSDQERVLRARLIEKKEELEQLKSDVKSISELDAAMDNALTQLLQQINNALGYEKQAWQKFKDIGQELDDKKAQMYYAHMEAALKNIDAILGYVTGPYAQYFTTILQKVHEYMASVKSRLDILKQGGIELKKKLEEVRAQEKKEEEKQAPAKKTAGFWAGFVSALLYPIMLLKRLWAWLFSLFGK